MVRFHSFPALNCSGAEKICLHNFDKIFCKLTNICGKKSAIYTGENSIVGIWYKFCGVISKVGVVIIPFHPISNCAIRMSKGCHEHTMEY